jgi:hypothetical protein
MERDCPMHAGPRVRCLRHNQPVREQQYQTCSQPKERYGGNESIQTRERSQALFSLPIHVLLR